MTDKTRISRNVEKIRYEEVKGRKKKHKGKRMEEKSAIHRKIDDQQVMDISIGRLKDSGEGILLYIRTFYLQRPEEFEYHFSIFDKFLN
jgi:hypothetical protein